MLVAHYSCSFPGGDQYELFGKLGPPHQGNRTPELWNLNFYMRTGFPEQLWEKEPPHSLRVSDIQASSLLPIILAGFPEQLWEKEPRHSLRVSDTQASRFLPIILAGFPEVINMSYLASSGLCIGAIACLANQSTARVGNALGMMGVAGGIGATLGLVTGDAALYAQILGESSEFVHTIRVLFTQLRN
jgi:hypothetical protein